MNAAHTPTPRTDAQEFIPVRECGHFPPYPTVSAGFARQLERELADADGTISHLRMENGLIEFYKCRDQIKELEGQLANMTAQRDALADALRELMFHCLRFRIEPSDDAYKNAESALVALEGRGSNPAQESPPTTP
jgi:hypothetical protein